MKYFVAVSTTRTAGNLSDIHSNSSIRFFDKLRIKIALNQETLGEKFTGKVKLDESYFGATRKGKRGRGASGKVAVFSILKRGGKVYTQNH